MYSTASASYTGATNKVASQTAFVVAGMWALTAVSAAMAPAQMGLGLALALFAGGLGLIFALFALRNSPWGLAVLAAFSVLQGISLGPVLSHYAGLPNGTQTVALAGALTAAATGGISLYAAVARKSFSRWAGFLFAGLIVLVVGQVVGLFFPSETLTLVLASAGALLFTAYLLMDISAVLNGEQDNYMVAALNIYLDMLNLFLSLLRLLGALSDE